MTAFVPPLAPPTWRRLAAPLLLVASTLLAWPAWSAAPFTDNGNGTVTDGTTHLVWDQCPYGLTGSACNTGTALLGDWAGALNAAATANAAHYKGFNDWRVPNLNELESIVKIDRFNPAADSAAFPGQPNERFWTSTSQEPAPGFVWLVYFGDGGIELNHKGNYFYVRLVRSGQPFAPFDLFPPSADLSITKTDGVTTVYAGGSLTYTITASNAGPSNAPGTVVADTLPAALSGATWTCVGAGGGTCTAAGSGNLNDTANLPAGGSVTYTLTATVSPGTTGTLSNTATVTAAAGITDPTPGNNSATDTDTVIGQADLAVTLTDSPDPVTAGANLTYTVTVNNAGPGAAISAQWNDTLPAGTTFVSLNTVAGWSCTTPAVGSAGTVTCNMASVPAASSAGFSLVVTVAPATPSGTVLTNTVTVSSATSDPTPGSNSATTTTTVAVVPPPPPPPEVSIPALTISRACGLVTWPSIVNMGAGEGPAFTADMVTILSNALGMPLRFVEQTAACGSVVLAGYNGGNLVFVPYGFLTGDNRPNGVYPVGNGQYQLVRNGQQITLAPALVHLEQLAALLPDVAATQLDTGAISADVNGVRYVLQPGVAVQVGEPSGTAQLTMGADGLYRFVDALGNTQVLYPAFAEPTTLRRILQGLDASATVTIALDGTATIDFNGQRYTLVPDLTVAPVPAEHAGQDWWQESETRYRLVNWQSLPVRTVSQGFTVRP